MQSHFNYSMMNIIIHIVIIVNIFVNYYLHNKYHKRNMIYLPNNFKQYTCVKTEKSKYRFRTCYR